MITGWQLFGPQLLPGPHTCGEHETPWQPVAELSAIAPRTAGGVYTAIRSKRRRAALIFSSWSSAMGGPVGGNLADNYQVLGGMLPGVDALFTLIQQLANRQPVTQVAVSKWLVQRHGLAPLVARAGVSSYRDGLAQASIQWARVEQELPSVVRTMREAGVRVAAIKGAAHAKTLYAAPAERPMADVDLLVPVKDLPAARTTLRRIGFSLAAAGALHHAEVWVRNDRVIDLHWSIIGRGRSDVDLEGIWRRARPGWPDGAEHLEPIDSLAFHLIHLSRNRLSLPLVNVIDTARMLEHVEASAAVARAHAWGLQRACAIALKFCASIIGGRWQRPAGWFGPSTQEIVALDQPDVLRKILFDTVVAGSPRQLAMRMIALGVNRLRN